MSEINSKEAEITGILSKFKEQLKFREVFTMVYQTTVAELKLPSEKPKTLEEGFWKGFADYLQPLKRAYLSQKSCKVGATKRLFVSDILDYMEKRQGEGYFQALKIEILGDEQRGTDIVNQIQGTLLPQIAN